MIDTSTLSFLKIILTLFLSGIVFICIAWLVEKLTELFEKFTGKTMYQRTHSWEEGDD